MRAALLVGAVLLLGPGWTARAGERPVLAIRNGATFRAILDAAEDPDRDVRSRVAWILGRAGREEGLAALRKLARDPVPDVRAGALEALGRLLPEGSRVEVGLKVPVKDLNLRLAALRAARQLVFEQRDDLIQAGLESEDPVETELAVRALALDDPGASRPQVLAALRSPHASVRAVAVEVLARAGDEEARARVLEALEERGSEDSFLVRAAACRALAVMGAESEARRLRPAVEDVHYLVRREAIRALAALGDREALPAIRKRASDEDYTVRTAACEALGEMVEEESAPVLADRLADSVEEVRAAAEAALEEFPPDKAYRPVLKYADYVDDADTRHRAWRLLGVYAHPQTRDIAFHHLEDQDSTVSGYALQVGRKLGDRRIIPHVIGLLQTRVVGSGPMGPIEAGPLPLEGQEGFLACIEFEVKEPIPFAVLCLERIRDKRRITGMLYIPDLRVAARAAEYLAAMNYQPAVPVLEQLLKSGYNAGDLEFLSAVAGALKRLTGKEYALPTRPQVQPLDVLFIDVRAQELPPAGEEIGP